MLGFNHAFDEKSEVGLDRRYIVASNVASYPNGVASGKKD
jgi:hypothetical protein